MAKKALHRIVICLSLLFFLEVSAHAFTDLIIFGDSLEDTGNFASLPHISLPPFPFFMGRITNGPVAVDILADGLGLSAESSFHLIGPEVGTNYAVVSARAHTTGPIDLHNQVSAFLYNHLGDAPSDALYIIGFGGNDLRDARDAMNEATAELIIKDTVEMIVMNIRRLVEAGARTIIVLNLPDIGAIPETRLISEMIGDKSLIEKTTKSTLRFNNRLSKRSRKVEKEFGIDLIEFDTFALFKDILEDSAALGFTDTTHACFSSVTFTFR
ncbi:MAG: SGNH/GDSL hydrolase family protein, partial [Nitrospiria bacterium]